MAGARAGREWSQGERERGCHQLDMIQMLRDGGSQTTPDRLNLHISFGKHNSPFCVFQDISYVSCTGQDGYVGGQGGNHDPPIKEGCYSTILFSPVQHGRRGAGDREGELEGESGW